MEKVSSEKVMKIIFLEISFIDSCKNLKSKISNTRYLEVIH